MAKHETLEVYLLRLAGEVAQNKIKMKLGMYKDPTQHDPFQISDGGCIEGNKMISSTVFKSLKYEAGAIISWSYRGGGETYNNNFFHSRLVKVPKTYYCTVDESWYNNYAPGQQVAPVFDLSGVDEKNDKVTEETRYKKLFSCPDFKSEEYIYISYHLDEYDIRKTIGTDRDGRSNGHTYYHIFPKAQLSELSKHVYYDHAQLYLGKHIQWAIKLVLGIETKYLGRLNIGSFDNTLECPLPDLKFESTSTWKQIQISAQHMRVLSYQRTLSRCDTELKAVTDAVDKFGGWDKFIAEARKAFIKYLQDNFPLHIDENEEDAELRTLAQQVAEGKDKGFSDRLQLIEKGAA